MVAAAHLSSERGRSITITGIEGIRQRLKACDDAQARVRVGGIMELGFDFRDLFVLDLANNHQGSVEHGLEVIRRHAEVVRKHGVRAAVKFQFRDLDTLVHPRHKRDSTNKHIPRFLSTRLGRADFESLMVEAREQNLYAMCTPFDEASAKAVAEMGFDLIKVASCSAQDWPLIEAAAETNLPVVFSTGGLSIQEIDNVAVFSEHRALDFALMHCVSIYPTPPEACNLQNIAMLQRRYPGVCIGWSTHEDPDAISPIQMAVAYGAKLFERHIGLATDTVTLNAYSSTPQQIDRWVSAWKAARELAGSHDRQAPQAEETAELKRLRRGVFAARQLKADAVLDPEDVYFAMPLGDGQLESGRFRGGIVVKRTIEKDEGLFDSDLMLP
jgi:sialic acid synthase SpsE